uniref:Uncharacterized protein n=1 Tax=Pristionchus pacificus TaxID=54126 RepID=A0A2A6CLA7_PRIPA|eukprot:PDM78982.1 hypothetical protein PRIPAC_31561 [Pristionchus pacificus]
MRCSRRQTSTCYMNIIVLFARPGYFAHSFNVTLRSNSRSRRSNCEGFSLHWDRLSFHIRIRFLLSNVQDWVGEIEIFHSGIRDLDFRALLVVSSCLDYRSGGPTARVNARGALETRSYLVSARLECLDKKCQQLVGFELTRKSGELRQSRDTRDGPRLETPVSRARLERSLSLSGRSTGLSRLSDLSTFCLDSRHIAEISTVTSDYINPSATPASNVGYTRHLIHFQVWVVSIDIVLGLLLVPAPLLSNPAPLFSIPAPLLSILGWISNGVLVLVFFAAGNAATANNLCCHYRFEAVLSAAGAPRTVAYTAILTLFFGLPILYLRHAKNAWKRYWDQ